MEPPEVAPLKRAAEDFSYSYREFDDSTLDMLTAKLGTDETPEMARHLIRFYVSLIQPDIFTPSTNLYSLDEVYRGLPIWLYPILDIYWNSLNAIISADRKWIKIMPEWYLDYYKKKMDVQMVNSYVVFVLNTYAENVERGNEVRRKWFMDRFPWVEEERRKTWYMTTKLRNKLVEISTHGIRNQGDLLFLYFSSQLLSTILNGQATNNVVPTDVINMFNSSPIGPRGPLHFLIYSQPLLDLSYMSGQVADVIGQRGVTSFRDQNPEEGNRQRNYLQRVLGLLSTTFQS